jgi:predicted N-formylglutamate amidohydrolase
MANHFSPELLLTCEHAGNKIPVKFQPYFVDANDVLKSHRGWDPGAVELAVCISEALQASFVAYPFSRLLIEPNRSEHHPKLFSEFTKNLSEGIKNELLNNYYRPHRKKVTDEIYRMISANKRVLHIGVHTFTPELNGRLREFDIGLLYDPSRTTEKRYAQEWKTNTSTRFRVRMNQPYKGKADGLITALRKLFSEEVYLGIELEVNQRLYFENQGVWEEICDSVSGFLSKVCR